MKHSEITKNDIKVLGRVVSITSNNTVASSEQIWDDNFDTVNTFTEQANHNTGSGANQYDINRMFAEAIANGIGGGNSNLTLNDVIANSGLGTPTAGDILYFNGTSWELKPITSLVYWKLDEAHSSIVPNTANTNGYVDVATTGSIYSGSLGGTK